MSAKTLSILNFWLLRARKKLYLKKTITNLLEKNTNIKCDYCDCDWGLRNEAIENIEEIYSNFL